MFLLNLLDDMLFAAIPAVGFALVFNVPPKALKYCAILGALGHVTRTLLLHFGVPIVFATFFATCVIGFIGVHLSHRYLAHGNRTMDHCYGSHLWCLFRYRFCIRSFKYCFVGGVIECFY